MARFEVYRTHKGVYRFRLIAPNGRILLTSEEYTTRQYVISAIDKIVSVAHSDENYKFGMSGDGYYFKIIARNGEILGISEIYDNERARKNGVDLYKRVISSARIVDAS